MIVIVIVVAAVLNPRVAAERAVTAAACAAAPKTMTFQCDNACRANIPCLANTTTVNGVESCKTKCLDKVYAYEKSFTIHTAFGSWKSAQQLAESPSPQAATAAPPESGIRQTENNNNLEVMEPLELPSDVTSVFIIGRSPYINGVKGHVSNVKFPSGLLAKCPNVTSLDLTNFNLEPQANAIASLLPPNLANLSLTNNLFTAIPPLGDVKALRLMKISLNYITSVNSTPGMDELTELQMIGNDITSFTAVFPKLKTLDLTDNKLRDFPAALSEYKALETLRLAGNKLNAIPSSVGLPPSVTSLEIKENNISSITAVFPKLEYLDLTSNALRELPAALAKFSSLQTIHVAGNNVTAIPSSVELPLSLTYLSISNNQIAEYDAVAPGLLMLNLEGNNLTAIPPAVFTHPKLVALYLQRNPMTNVTVTPVQYRVLAGLNSFAIDNTSLRTDCPGGELKPLRTLLLCVLDVNTDASTDNTDSTSSSTGLVVGIALGVVAFVAIIIAVVCMRSRNNAKATTKAMTYTTADGTIRTRHPTNSTGTTSLWDDDALLAIKVDDDDIDDVRVLGKGAFGDVWLVRYRVTQLLASKRLRKSGVSPAQTQQFIDEIKLVATLEHPHIVTFVGAAWTIQSDLQALFEYMDGGDLRDYLTNSKQTPRTWTPQKLQIAIDVADALVYVHSFAPPLVHRDLKSRNVLLGSGDNSAGLVAKLTDFGVSRYKSENNTMTTGVGTAKWVAPEVIAGSSDYGAPADIFSFGAVLTELDTHVLPYDDVIGRNGAKLADVALLQQIAGGELRPQFSATCPVSLAELGNRCFALDPSMRPVAAEIAYALRQLKKSLFAAV